MKIKNIKIICMSVMSAIAICSCNNSGSNSNNQESSYESSNKIEEWTPDPDMMEISPLENMKTYGGKEIKNTALVGRWNVELRIPNDNEDSLAGIIFQVNKDKKFTLTIPSSISNTQIEYLKKCFSNECKKGMTFEGTVKCYDTWCAEGEGPDGSYAIELYDNNGKKIHSYAFVYCQINDNEFTLDELQGSGIAMSLVPTPLRKFKELVYPDDYISE
jgi:hypothetical protein